MEVHHLRVHHHSPGVQGQVCVVEAPIESLLGHRLVVRLVEIRQVRQLQGLGGRDPLLRIKHKHPGQQVYRVLLNPFESLGERHRLAPRKRQHKLQGVLGADGLDDVVGRGAQQLCYYAELVDVVVAWEEWLGLEHLGKDARRRPDVHLGVVLLPGQHDLGGPVEPGGHVSRHLRILDSGQAKVADFQVAAFVDQYIGRLQVTVDDPSRVDVLETPQDLVQEVFDELWLQWSGTNKSVQVCALELGDKIDVFGGRQENVVQADQVLVAQQLQQLELSIGSLGQHVGLERSHNLLYGYLLVGQQVVGRTHQPKGAHSHGL